MLHHAIVLQKRLAVLGVLVGRIIRRPWVEACVTVVVSPCVTVVGSKQSHSSFVAQEYLYTTPVVTQTPVFFGPLAW